MPEPAVAPPPAPTPAPAPAPVAAPASPSSPPKPGSARERLQNALAAKAGIPQTSETPKPAPTTAPTPEPKPEPSPEPKAELTAAAAPAEKGKISPWKLVDQYKQKLAAAEAEVLETKKRIVPEADAKELRDKLTAAETRIKEYEDEVRFTNYSKSQEFKEKYEKPYQMAWQRAVKELNGINITLDDGTKRPMAMEDLQAIIQMPLGSAREIADATFGAFADDVMRFRNEIRSLADQQLEALDEARKNGGAREKARQEELQRTTKAVAEDIAGTWKKVNDAILKDETLGPLFSPKDGDDEWNSALKKGYEFVDRAFGEDPRDPKLTPEQRREVIKRHAAVRNRAATWTMIRNSLFKAESRIKDLEKQLSQYKSSTPGNGNGAPSTTPTTGSARSRILGAFEKMAK